MAKRLKVSEEIFKLFFYRIDFRVLLTQRNVGKHLYNRYKSPCLVGGFLYGIVYLAINCHSVLKNISAIY